MKLTNRENRTDWFIYDYISYSNLLDSNRICEYINKLFIYNLPLARELLKVVV